MDHRLSSYKEVIPSQTQSDVWTEFTLNTGGALSTLQDIKVQQRSDGYCYKNSNNRFIYWRSNHDVLELVEQTLDMNLSGNQVRYRFVDTPILEGVSIHETSNSVVVLVPTVSSVHRLTYPHPHKLNKQGPGDTRGNSIFSDANFSAIRDPRSYHILTSLPCLPHAAASCLTANENALFALAFNTGSILLVTMDPLSGTFTSNELRHDSIVPRFLSGITEALLGKQNENNTPVSLVLHPMLPEVYLFSLSRDGQMRVWTCSTGHCINVSDTLQQHPHSQIGEGHLVRKATNSRGELLLCVFLSLSQGSQLIIIHTRFQAGLFKFTTLCSAETPKGNELVDICVCGEGVWCLWVSGEGEPGVSYFECGREGWMWAQLNAPPPLYPPYTLPAHDPRQIYVSAIFQQHIFNPNTIHKALNIYRRGEGEDGSDLKRRVCQAVEAEIQTTAAEYELTDEEYIDVAERCWSRFYSCCVQYLQGGMTPLGLVWLKSAGLVILIKKTGFSLLRPIDQVESFVANKGSAVVEEAMALDNEETRGIMELALHRAVDPREAVAEIASTVQQWDNTQILDGMTETELEQTLEGLLDALSKLGTSDLKDSLQLAQMDDSDAEVLKSDLAISAVVNTLRQVTAQRLSICYNLLLLLEMAPFPALSTLFSGRISELCRHFWVLHWLSLSTDNAPSPPILHLFLAAHPDIMQSTLLASAYSLARNIWPGKNSEVLARFLLSKKHYLMLQELSRLLGDTHNWRMLLAQSFLEIAQPYKALDLVVSENNTTQHYLQVIQMFERENCPDVVITLAEIAIRTANLEDPNLATLHSLLFLHHLKLHHWEKAYRSLQANPDADRRSDCLRQLVVPLVSAGRLDVLLSFPYAGGLLPHLLHFLHARARALHRTDGGQYYNLLYALYVDHDNFKKAAGVMFEKGLLSDDVVTQQQCYGACLNALLLVNPQYAWLVKPHFEDKGSVEVLEVADIRREYELANARVKLGLDTTDCSARDLITQCVSVGHYKMALRIADICQLGVKGPLEALASACVRISDNDDAWEWLILNEISELVVGDANAGTVAWRLLECLMMRYEVEMQTTLHKAVASKLMSLAMFLPHWLETSYRKRNAGELIRLYMCHGYLKEASVLASDLLSAALDTGNEHFGLKNTLVATKPSLCLPINTIDLLITQLQFHNMEADVKAALDRYVETALQVTKDKIISYGK